MEQINIGCLYSERYLIHIRQGKRSKDRYTLLSEMALEVVRIYFKKYGPEQWLSPGTEQGSHLRFRDVMNALRYMTPQYRGSI